MTPEAEVTVTDGLVRMTVFLTPAAYSALEETAEALGDTRTDTVNRSIHLYAAVNEVAAEGGGVVQMVLDDGHRAVLHVTTARVREIAPSAQV